MAEILADIQRPSFRYRPLNAELRQIRVVSILPGYWSADVDCRIEHASLEHDQTYKAPSYTWGDPNITLSISLDGNPFPITRNLKDALQHLRSESETVKLWVDAICINQGDKSERNVQVRQMKDIYEKAVEVLVWLGKESDDSGHAISVMDQIPKRWASRSPQFLDQFDRAAPSFDERSSKALDLLLDRPWWRRIWIIQEATCLKNTYLMCGKCKTTFTAAIATANLLALHAIKMAFARDFDSPDITRFQRVISLDEIRLGRIQKHQSIDLLWLLDQSRTCEASDPKDRLYALLGLVNHPQNEGLDPNYFLDVTEVYQRFVSGMIETQNSLNVLGHCQASSSLELSLPSWAPDWTVHLEATPFKKNYFISSNTERKIYRASGDHRPIVRRIMEPETLIVRGFEFDTVLGLGENFDEQFTQSTLKRWETWALEKLGSVYHTGKKTQDAFSNTFFADVHGTSDAKQSLGFQSLQKMALNARGFFISKQGYMGLARHDVKKGNIICILLGGQVPFVLQHDGGEYRFKGECYIHGWMYGDAMDYPTVWKDFTLH